MKSGNLQKFTLTVLRLMIGWHFLYEGGIKLLNPGWTSRSYLLDSAWIFKGAFEWIANNSNALAVADLLNAWGLLLIGLALILGIFTRIASISGIVLLLLYYFSHPSLLSVQYMFPSEGSYFIVNKNLIECAALWVLYAFPTSAFFGVRIYIGSKSRLFD